MNSNNFVLFLFFGIVSSECPSMDKVPVMYDDNTFLCHPVIPNAMQWGLMQFSFGGHGEHGKDGKPQPNDLKHLIYDPKHSLYDSKHSICQPDDYFTAYKARVERFISY